MAGTTNRISFDDAADLLDRGRACACWVVDGAPFVEPAAVVDEHGRLLVEVDGIAPGDLVGLVGSVLTSWKALLGLACFGASSLFWLVVLSRLPLSTAYPFVALSYLIILGFSTIVLHERPPLLTWGGAALIMTGIVMIGTGGFERGS